MFFLPECLIKKIDLLTHRIRNRHKDSYECPGCHYFGPFEDIAPATGVRKQAKCPQCGSLERHRLQLLVLKKLLGDRLDRSMKVLHMAPEPIIRSFFEDRFNSYDTADLNMDGVDHNVNLLDLPFADGSYDLVFASHVLEHIVDDRQALAEIGRILSPHGVAILPVPIVLADTVEYPEPNPLESGHVRAPGLDYYQRYEQFFSDVELYSSDSLEAKFQLYVHENRSCDHNSDNEDTSQKHPDYVPVCYK